MKTLPKSLVYAALAGSLALGSSCKKEPQENRETSADEMVINDTLLDPAHTSDTDTVFPTDGTNSGTNSSTSLENGKAASQTTTATAQKNEDTKSKTSAKKKKRKVLRRLQRT